MREIKFRIWENRIMNYNPSTWFSESTINDEFNNDRNVMQFTGVRDINSTDIYEGDIIRASYSIMTNEISKVEFKRGIFFVLKNGRYHPLSEFMYDSRDKTRDIEIIGNIYENPELLEQGRVVTQISEPMSR